MHYVVSIQCSLYFHVLVNAALNFKSSVRVPNLAPASHPDCLSFFGERELLPLESTWLPFIYKSMEPASVVCVVERVVSWLLCLPLSWCDVSSLFRWRWSREFFYRRLRDHLVYLSVQGAYWYVLKTLGVLLVGRHSLDFVGEEANEKDWRVILQRRFWIYRYLKRRCERRRKRNTLSAYITPVHVNRCQPNIGWRPAGSTL